MWDLRLRWTVNKEESLNPREKLIFSINSVCDAKVETVKAPNLW